MNREIKFRAWNGNNMVDLYETTPFAVLPDLKIDGLFIPFKEEFILMQFTGMTDSWNKPIYEGDIVTCPHNQGRATGVIEYERQAAAYWVKWTFMKISRFRELKATYSDGDVYMDESIEIIGNIYENKDLLAK